MGSDATQPVKRLGAWLARTNNTVYQAASDGFVCGYTPNGSTPFLAYTDGANPPVTIRVQNYSNGAAPPCGNTMAVRKGDYWKVTGATGALFWVPLEP